MKKVPGLVITKLAPDEIKEVSFLLAKSMCENPNHVAIFGSAKNSSIVKQKKMFEMAIKNSQSTTYTAKINGHIVGSMTFLSSEFCQVPKIEIIKMLPKLSRIFAFSLIPVLKWRMSWAKHDHNLKHIHFGPIAVSKNHRRKGVGKEMLKFFCNYLDEINELGYLETDKLENVALYEQFGFRIIEVDSVFNNNNWFMLRELKK